MTRTVCMIAMILMGCFGGSYGFGQNSRPMSPGERQNFHVWRWGMASWRSLGNGMVEQVYQSSFWNKNNCEVMSVTVEIVAKRDRRQEVFRSKPITISFFRNEFYPYDGSLLPQSRSFTDPNIRFTRPSSTWTSADYTEFEVKEVRVWNGKGDYHNVGHYFAKTLPMSSADIINLLKADPALLKLKAKNGYGTMLVAYSTGDVPVLRYLQSKGLDPAVKTTQGHTGMFLALSPENQEFALKAGCKVDARLPKSGRTALMKFCSFGVPSAAQWLLAHGANPNIQDNAQLTALRYAVMNGQPGMVDLLVKAKADVRFRDKQGLGLMHDCIYNYNMYPVVKQLGLSVDDMDPKLRVTPLMIAAEHGTFNAVSWLLQNGANTEIKDHKGHTARDYAKRSNTRGSDEFYLEWVRRFKPKPKPKRTGF